MSIGKTVLVLLIATIGATCVQAMSTGLRSEGDRLEVQWNDGKSAAFQANDRQQVSQGTFVHGPIVVQTGNVYDISPDTDHFYGARVIQSGNIYPESHGGNNIVGAVVRQTGNTYYDYDGTNGINIVVKQTGNTYNGKQGDNNVYGAIVSQTGNTYHIDGTKGIHFGSVVKQTGNTYNGKQGDNNIFEATGNTYHIHGKNGRNLVIGSDVTQIGNTYRINGI